MYLVTLSHELGVQAVFFAPHLTYMPLLWEFLSFSVHLSGVIALRLRTCLLEACHVGCDNLAFSSMLFISVTDSLMVISRFMTSVLLCRGFFDGRACCLRDLFNDDTRLEAHGSGFQLVTFDLKSDSLQTSQM
jgi:hypothetical protein